VGKIKNKEKSENLKKAIAEALGRSGSTHLDAATEEVLKELDRQKIIRYGNDDYPDLLSSYGRILVSILEDGTLTARAMSVYLGISLPVVDRALRRLADSGIITKTKVNRQNIYSINKDEIKKHPDIQRFLGVIQAVGPEEEEVF
jgi:DNA-binding transcriptional regulator GbsR (MarR family)